MKFKFIYCIYENTHANWRGANQITSSTNSKQLFLESEWRYRSHVTWHDIGLKFLLFTESPVNKSVHSILWAYTLPIVCQRILHLLLTQLYNFFLSVIFGLCNLPLKNIVKTDYKIEIFIIYCFVRQSISFFFIWHFCFPDFQK